MNEKVRLCKSRDELFWRCVIFLPLTLIGVPVVWLLFFVKFLIDMVVDDCVDIKNELASNFKDGFEGLSWMLKSIGNQWRELGEKPHKDGQSSPLTR